MLQYMKHKDHGTHIVYNLTEREICAASDWVCVEHPHDDPFTEVSERYMTEVERALELKGKTIPELKEIAERLELTIHPRAKEDSIIKKIMENELYEAQDAE